MTVHPLAATDPVPDRDQLSRRQRELLERRLAQARQAPPAEQVPARPDPAAPFRVSLAQEGIWFMEQLHPGGCLYNICRVLRLRGRLDRELLRRSLARVADRQESLRLRFFRRAGEAFAEAVPAGGAPAPLPLLDLRGVPAPAHQRELERATWQQADAPFDLARGGLWRTLLVRLAGDEHALVLTVHHLVFDGWSWGALFRDVAACYRGARGGDGATAATSGLPLTFGDFALWERRQLDEGRFTAGLDHWRERLAGLPPLFEMPADRPRPALLELAAGRARLRLGGDLTAGLRRLAAAEGASPFMVLLAGWAALLARYSDRRLVLVSTPVAGRHHTAAEPLVGCFVNTALLPVDLGPDLDGPTVRELLARSRDSVLEALAHQRLPFSRLVEELAPERSLAYAPVAQITLVLENTPASELALDGIAVVATESVERGRPDHDLSLSLEERGAELEALLVYNASLFDPATAARLLAHLERLLAAMPAAPERTVADLPLLSGVELHQLTAAWSGPEVTYREAVPLHSLFEAQAAARPDKVALIAGEQALSYAELERRANQLARRLRRLGVELETPVGLLLGRSAQMIVAVLGVLEAGGAYVPIDPFYPPDRIAFMLADAGVGVVVTEGPLASSLAGSGCRCLCLDREAESLAAESGAGPGIEVPADSLAYVIYTSGSTGRPKGTLISHRNVTRLLRCADGRFDFDSRDVWALFHSLAFDFSVWEMWGALALGGCLVVVPHWVSRSPGELLDLLAARRVTVLCQTPSAFRQLAEADARRAHAAAGIAAGGGAGNHLSDLRWLIFGGEALAPASLAGWFDRHGDRRPLAVNMYGITETTVHSTFRVIESADLATPWISPIGQPLPDLSLHLLDRGGRPVPVGVAGEIHVGGGGLARGYFGRPDLTAWHFLPDAASGQPGARLYRSGDLARWLPRGEMAYLGRLDHQVKVRGFRVELGEIEAALAAHPVVRECAVAVAGSGGEPRRLAAYVAARAGAEIEVQELRQHLRQLLPDHMVPASWTVLAALPVNASGKLDRRALPAPQGAPARAAAGAQAPRAGIEELVAGIWHEILGISELRTQDNFFDLGGHSLDATRLMFRLEELLGVELPVRALYEAPTLAELARRIEDLLLAAGGGESPATGEGATARARRLAERLQEARGRAGERAIPRRAAAGPAPLSWSQELLWFVEQLEPGSSVYRVSERFDLGGALDEAALRWSLDALARRHEILRSRFVAGPRPGLNFQVVDPSPAVALHVVDLTGIRGEAKEREAELRLDQAALQPFDLGRGPLVRPLLVRLGPRRHWLLLTLHHIVVDDWAVGLFCRELGTLYDDRRAGREPRLPALSIQYADFATWERGRLQGDALAGLLGYWGRQLHGGLPQLALRTDFPRPAVASLRGASCYLEIPFQLLAELRRRSRARGVSLFMSLLAAYQLMLARHSGQTDVVVGCPNANRPRAQTEELLGCFVNLLMLRTDLGGDPTLREVLGRVRETALGAYAHQQTPFLPVAVAFQPPDHPQGKPVFQAMFTFRNTPLPRLAMAGLTVERRRSVERGATDIDLTLVARETAGELEVYVIYDIDLFTAATAGRMLADFRGLLEAIATRPESRLSELP
jgi:amino acid adenylation domain-containing protein